MTATTQEKHFIKKSARLSKLTVQLNNPARLHKRTYAHTIKQCTDAWSSCVWNPCQSHVHSTNATHAHLLEQPHECLRQLTMMERRRSMLESTSTVTASKTADRWRRHALHTFTADRTKAVTGQPLKQTHFNENLYRFPIPVSSRFREHSASDRPVIEADLGGT